MMYEVRVYHMHPGKMQDIQDRFKNHTLPIFKRHGIKVVDFWVGIAGQESENSLCYVVEYESIAQRDELWKRFQEDPEWIAAREKSIENGPITDKIESYYMEKAPYFYE